MILIRENTEKKRKTYKLKDRYRKIWSIVDLSWQEFHIALLTKIVPNYVLDYGNDNRSMWIDYRIIKGTPASEFLHTDDFIKQIYEFCINNIRSTQPYVHGDWVLSNIIIDGNNMTMCDWDNLNIYPEEDVIKKLRNDLRSAFGPKFDEVINDSTSI